MPGLIRGVARTAVVAGTASAVAGRVNHHQQEKWAGQSQPQYAEPQYAPPPPQYAAPAPVYAAPPAPVPAAEPEVDRMAQLKQLGDLHTQGILTDEEFASEKAKILNS
jgi:hypothetical protein